MSKKQNVVKIVHLSDIHFLEEKVLVALRPALTYGLEGLSYYRLKKLTEKLNMLDFDIVLLTGDYGTLGEEKCYKIAKKWLKEEILPQDVHAPKEETESFGLHLEKQKIPFVTIPGNHDYYRIVPEQTDCEWYNKYFAAKEEIRFIHKDKEYIMEEKEINGVKVRFHKFDSCKIGSPAKGIIHNIENTKMITNEKELDIVMLHHHCVYPFNLAFNESIMLENNVEVTKFFLKHKINAILFGHTHVGYLNYHQRSEIEKMADKDTWSGEVPQRHINEKKKMIEDHTVISMAASASNAGDKVCGFNVITYDMEDKTVLLEEYYYNNKEFVKMEKEDIVIPHS